ncbi:DUF945 family protein [Marinobacter bohaiensis]|uniref:DUF945 family protein n=1 Tax=Marinobacter bohaiensis TaxID=2201898 RepID=UPI000DAD4A6C|nr:DUF945 family protein [Marinobacter bohaiensis]
MKKWILAGAVVLVVVILAAPYGVGVATEQQWQNAVARFNSDQPIATVVTETYERHYFGADLAGYAEVTDPDTGEVHRLAFNGEATHGVLSSSVNLEPVREGETLTALFPDELPNLRIKSWLWGTLEADFNVPAIDLVDDATGETLNTTEAYGWAKITDAGDHVEANVRWPGVILRSGGMRASLDDFELTQEAQRVADSLWSGDVEMTIASMDLVDGDQAPVHLEGLTVTSDTRPEKDDTKLSSEASFLLDEVSVGDDSYGPHRVDIALDNLDVAAWTRFQSVATEIQMLQAQPDPNMTQQALFQQQMMLMQKFSQAAKGVAAAGLTIGMPTIDLKSADGDITGHWKLSHPAVPADQRADMPLIVQQLTGELDLSAPVALFQSEPEMAANLENLVQQGILTRDGDRYRIEAEVADMAVNLNGREMPIPPLL